MLASMDPKTGRVGVVMPHGVLFRGGAEGKIRQCLIEQDRLEAVIGLAPNLFYSTSIPACLLIFRADKPAVRRQHVLFIDASDRFTKNRNQNSIGDADIQAILDAYRTGEDPDGEGGIRVRLVPDEEIAQNNYDLNIGRYIKATAADTVDLPTALAAYEQARAARIESERALFERLKVAGIADLGGSDE
jgi:type I restriction enzyme M protein